MFVVVVSTAFFVSSDFFDSDAPLQGTRTSTSDANLPTNTKRRNSYSQVRKCFLLIAYY
jgi:hypothetical protein